MTNKCFAVKENGECKALTFNRCIGESCVFFKTRKVQNESLKRASERLKQLPIESQIYIAEKYHNGKMLWIKGGEHYDY